MAHEEEICTRISDSVKMAGFLEKKGKMKIISAWKKYWFVLEERLLLYYRSQIEYINLSPCRGSLNMGLVTTVRPGSSSGPCIIHVITRTQVVQLRAKNRATQEEWLQALLDSMSLPLITKTLKSSLISDLHGHRYSMDNISAQNILRKTGSERNEKPKSFEFRKKNLNDDFHGGSLDTIMWSKKLRTVCSPSPNIPKGKMLEKVIGYVDHEVDAKSTSDMISLIEDDVSNSSPKSNNKKFHEKYEHDREDKYAEKTDYLYESKYYNNSIMKGRKSLSDNELNDEITPRGKEDSQFQRIRNAVKTDGSRAFKSRNDLDRKSSKVVKRRQSFLQRVFRKHYKIANSKVEEGESDSEDPLYDTIKNDNELKGTPSSSTAHSLFEVNNDSLQEQIDPIKVADASTETTIDTQHENRETQKPVFGSKSILSDQAMSELKKKLKSRESIEFHAENEQVLPDLPPRSKSIRPTSPWHDVPTNNTLINAEQPFLLPDGERNTSRNISTTDFYETASEIKAAEKQDEGLEARFQEQSRQEALLLELPEVTGKETVTESRQDNWHKPGLDGLLSDPDYDVPRPHKLVNLCVPEDGNNLIETDFLKKGEESSDSSYSFHSIEPDSLESSEKKNSKI